MSWFISNRSMIVVVVTARSAWTAPYKLLPGEAPQSHRRVAPAASCGESFPIRRKRERLDPASVTCQRTEELACRGIPELDGSILTATRQNLGIRRELH